MRRWCFLALCAAAALSPLAGRSLPESKPAPPLWPASYEGASLRPVALSGAEQKFHATFPGSVARFTDGRREFIFRWITTGTRKLHSGADCFRGLGYTVTPAAPELGPHGERWSTFTAVRGAHRLRVRERITSPADGQSWTDVSAWYWSTLLRSTKGPWLAVTVAEPAKT